MTKGKPWTIEEETELKTLLEAKTPISTIAAKLGKQPGAIFIKCQRLGLTPKSHIDVASIPLPKELPSVEDALKKLAYAMELASTPGLDKAEVQRLQLLVTSTKAYKEILVDYINYREIEAKLNEMEAKYARLLEETSKNDASKPDSAQMAKTPTNQPPN